MDIFWEELTRGLPDTRLLTQVLIRLTAAALLGGAIGVQREWTGKPAGLRTHILVTLGSTVFMLACLGYGMSSDGVSRVIQGIVTGIGFIGAGSILKLNDEHQIKGLTTAASVWIAASVGVAVGLGGLGLALLSTILTLIVLTFVHRIELRLDERRKPKAATDD